MHSLLVMSNSTVPLSCIVSKRTTVSLRFVKFGHFEYQINSGKDIAGVKHAYDYTCVVHR
jgi:hypothetical protein